MVSYLSCSGEDSGDVSNELLRRFEPSPVGKSRTPFGPANMKIIGVPQIVAVNLCDIVAFLLFSAYLILKNSSADMNKTALLIDCFNPPGTHFVSNQRFQFLCLLKLPRFFKLGSSDEISG